MYSSVFAIYSRMTTHMRPNLASRSWPLVSRMGNPSLVRQTTKSSTTTVKNRNDQQSTWQFSVSILYFLAGRHVYFPIIHLDHPSFQIHPSLMCHPLTLLPTKRGRSWSTAPTRPILPRSMQSDGNLSLLLCYSQLGGQNTVVCLLIAGFYKKYGIAGLSDDDNHYGTFFGTTTTTRKVMMVTWMKNKANDQIDTSANLKWRNS